MIRLFLVLAVTLLALQAQARGGGSGGGKLRVVDLVQFEEGDSKPQAQNPELKKIANGHKHRNTEIDENIRDAGDTEPDSIIQ